MHMNLFVEICEMSALPWIWCRRGWGCCHPRRAPPGCGWRCAADHALPHGHETSVQSPASCAGDPASCTGPQAYRTERDKAWHLHYHQPHAPVTQRVVQDHRPTEQKGTKHDTYTITSCMRRWPSLQDRKEQSMTPTPSPVACAGDPASCTGPQACRTERVKTWFHTLTSCMYQWPSSCTRPQACQTERVKAWHPHHHQLPAPVTQPAVQDQGPAGHVGLKHDTHTVTSCMHQWFRELHRATELMNTKG